jgi:hypothetical protein
VQFRHREPVPDRKREVILGNDSFFADAAEKTPVLASLQVP